MQRGLARGEELARNVDADVAGVGEIQHRREERGACDARVLARREHRERAREQRAADAEAERVDACCRAISRATRSAVSTP